MLAHYANHRSGPLRNAQARHTSTHPSAERSTNPRMGIPHGASAMTRFLAAVIDQRLTSGKTRAGLARALSVTGGNVTRILDGSQQPRGGWDAFVDGAAIYLETPAIALWAEALAWWSGDEYGLTLSRLSAASRLRR